MVEARVREKLKTSVNGAAFGVVRAVDEVWDARLNHRAGAHAARLNRDVECSAREAIVSQYARGFAKYNHFGVCRGITVANRPVAGAREDSAVTNQSSPNRNLSGSGRGARLGERFLHEFDVGIHRQSQNNMRDSRNLCGTGGE